MPCPVIPEQAKSQWFKPSIPARRKRGGDGNQSGLRARQPVGRETSRLLSPVPRGQVVSRPFST